MAQSTGYKRKSSYTIFCCWYSQEDPEVRTWFLIKQKSLPFLLTILYVVFSTKLGPALMKNRKPFEFRNVMIIFNFSLVITYSWILLCLLYSTKHATFELFCYGAAVKKGSITYVVATVCWVYYVIKYVEFFDTVFFILRKKYNQVTFLHVAHHSLVPLCIWLILRTEISGMLVVPGVMNSFVHVVMYSYYGLSAFGPEVRKYLWWKKYLTQMQILQFAGIISFAMIVAPLTGCRIRNTSYLIQFTLGPLFLYLFYVYYRSTFKPKKTAAEDDRRSRTHEINHRVPEEITHMNVESKSTLIPENMSKKQE